MNTKKQKYINKPFPKAHLTHSGNNPLIHQQPVFFSYYAYFSSFDTDNTDPNEPKNVEKYFQFIITPIQNNSTASEVGMSPNSISNKLILYLERFKIHQEAPLLCNISDGELVCLIWDRRSIELDKLLSILHTSNNNKKDKYNTLEGHYVPYIIIQPCLRLGVTTLSSSFYCQRKSILSVLTPSFSSNVNTIIGTHLHELIQSSLTLKSLNIEVLKKKTKELIFRDCLEINKAGQSVNYILEKVSFYFPYILSFHNNLIKQNLFLNTEKESSRVEIFNVEEPINSITFGLSGYIDIILKVDDKLYIVELKTMFNNKPLNISSVNSAYISQVTLYIAMLNEKYNLNLESAYIYNILNPSYEFLEVKHDPNVLRNIINARNKLIYHLNPENPLPQAISCTEERKRKCTDCIYNKKCAVLNYSETDNHVDIEEFENIFYWDEAHLNFINDEFRFYKEEIYKVLTSHNYLITEGIKTFKICKFEVKNNKLSIFTDLNKKNNGDKDEDVLEFMKGRKFLCLNEINNENNYNEGIRDIRFMLIKRLNASIVTEVNVGHNNHSKINKSEDENCKKYVFTKELENIFEEKYVKRILNEFRSKEYFITQEKFKGALNNKINLVLDTFIKGNLENDHFSSFLINKLNL